MLVLAGSSFLTGKALQASEPAALVEWLARSMVVKAALPFVWLGFSLMYSRGDYRTFVLRWRIPLIAFALVPIAALVLEPRLLQAVPPATPSAGWVLEFSVIAQAIHGAMLVGFVLILMNLEQTFRSAVGTMRWRIKFVVLALGVIFGTSIYVGSQALLFSSHDLTLSQVDATGLLIGCACLALAYARTGLAEVDVYPSLAVLRSSVTIVVVGSYLFVVGLAAQLVKQFGGAEIFQFQALVLLVGITGLAVLLLSDRARQKLDSFTSQHFRRAQHDSVRVWGLFSRRLASVKDQADLSTVCARLISETFEALTVTVWLVDEEKRQLVVGASTAGRPRTSTSDAVDICSAEVVTALETMSSPFDLEERGEPWREELRQLNQAAFPEGGHRLCVPLRAGEQSVGAIVLADRVSAVAYSAEDIELLKCIAEQIASVLTNLRLASEVARARELDAFRTMSAFFVHDLKNAATSLNLMLKNLPVHFNDPAFRADALRGVGATARRIDDTIARLNALRNGPNFSPVEADLNELVREVLGRVNGMPNVELTQEFEPVPAIFADREQVQSVVTNLVLNARDALGAGGRIRVRTQMRDHRVVLSVADNGCGMSPAFVQHSLFRPFQSTKKQGLGIGLFQSRAIVRAHGGGMHVESEVGKGTTFLVSFPVRVQK
jgi:putative PEP-CTERM system histidine kinase